MLGGVNTIHKKPDAITNEKMKANIFLFISIFLTIRLLAFLITKLRLKSAVADGQVL